MGFEPWELDALCAQVGAEVFFPDQQHQGEGTQAKRICGKCPVTDECLARALQYPGCPGIWGGTSENERRRLHREGIAA